MIREVENPRLLEFFKKNNASTEGKNFNDVNFVGSGKGALHLVLKHLIKRGVIKNKLDEIMVPDWIGYWVYNQIQISAFPTKEYTPRTKAMIVYHQYGFPQDMNKIIDFAQSKNLIIIEDCAHSLYSHYKGQRTGTFGDYAIYSFSKWFFSFALGGVVSNADPDEFRQFYKEEISLTPKILMCLKDFVKYIYEKNYFTESNRYKRFFNLLLSMSYAVYGDTLKPSTIAISGIHNKIEREIDVRKKRFQMVIQEMSNFGICDYVSDELEIAPYIIPLFCSEKNERICKLLHEEGISAGVYHFDVNRNLLSPKFVQCVWLPCHSHISDQSFFRMIELIKKNI